MSYTASFDKTRMELVFQGSSLLYQSDLQLMSPVSFSISADRNARVQSSIIATLVVLSELYKFVPVH